MAREQYEVRWKDYYEVLQVHPRAELEVILAAYRKLAQMYHPDSPGAPSNAHSRMVEINEAKEVLSDPARRATYDQEYRARQGNSASESGGWSQRGSTSNPHGNQDEYEWDNQWQSDWDAPEEGPSSSHRSAYQPPRGQSSHSSYSGFLSNFLAKVSPNPDERQSILPWPSWGWQRLALVAGIPLFLFAALITGAQGAWAMMGITLLLAAASLYAGVTTKWLRAAQRAPLPARIAGGTCITVSGTSYALGIAYAVLVVVVMILIFAFMGAMLKAWAAGALNKYK